MIAYILLFVIFAVQNCVKNLKNALFACSNITSQVGISSPRASRSREHIPPNPPLPPIMSHMPPLNVADITRSWASFSGAAMTTRMVREGFTLQNKVCVILCVCVRPSAPVLIRQYSLFSLAAVSHHPPVSAFYYVSPANKIAIVGELRPKSKFLGNSVSTVMEGHSRITLLGRPEDSGKSIAHSSLSTLPPSPSPHEAKDAC
jgi:hypothetical protein